MWSVPTRPDWSRAVLRLACAIAASRLLTASGALLGRSLVAEADDGVVVEPVGLRSVAAIRVVGIALGMLLRCTRPAVTVAPEWHAVDLAEAAGRLLCSLGDRLLLAGLAGTEQPKAMS